ncbi:amino acid adenylation domain-containing protein [Nonomuraea sp. NPDC050643]|uniref:amino acid adenylation domain-containing protein n=1 Tax=Nonomuraea sp. NPDC050643 TaxID=3155660 RepID=UPI0033F8194F
MTMPPTVTTTTPLTGAQAGIWYAQRLDPGNPVYNTADRVDIRGPLNPGVFERALERCLAEADPLRLRFTEGPAQYLNEYDSLRGCLTVLDLRGAADPEAAAQEWMRADLRTPVDLVTGRLTRHALLRLTDDHAVWYLRAHHILIDAYALSMLVGRMAEIYTALADGLTPGAGPFGSMASVPAEEAAYRVSEQYAADRAYWLGRLGGAPEPAGLAGTPAMSAREIVRRRAPLPPAGHWDGLAREAHATWADVAAAGLACYLGRLTGTTDVLIGLSLMNRSGATLRVPCLTVNVLPVRLDVRPWRTLGELVGDAARRVAEARGHGRYRIEDLRRDLGLGGRALFGPMLNIKPFASEVKFGAAVASVTNLASGPVDDLAVALLLDGERLTLELDGNAARYSEEALAVHTRRLAGFLGTLAAYGPDTPLGRLPVLMDEDRTALNLPRSAGADPDRPDRPKKPRVRPDRLKVPAPRADLLNVPAARPPADDLLPGRTAWTVVDAFLDQVRATPEATALTCDGASLTFAELGARVDRLARSLLAQGAGPERIVAVTLPRSAELVIALLAVLRSGAAFLPIDPSYPAGRRELMLADAAPSIVLTTAWDPPAPSDVVVPAPSDAVFPAPSDVVFPAPEPGHPAYVIYTSGSTGRPQGVVGTHAGLAALLAGHRERLFPAGERLRVAHTASFSFDASLDPLLWMIGGHELHLLGDDTYRDPEALTSYVREHAVDYLDLTPSHLKELPGLLARPPRITVVGGEAVPAPLWRTLRDRTLAVDHYGPTEATVDAYTWLGDGSEGPTAGTSVHVLDDALQPAPPGVTGELYLAGEGLARGYLGRPELTADRFVAGPGGTRMYRTGDRARWAAPGRLRLLGRADDQVKVRGVRVEPAEIEAALEEHPGVNAAAVAAHGHRLVAYVVPSAEGAAEGAAEGVAARLAEHAAARLPAGMAPAAYVAMDSLPRTPNGKLDRAALPAPEADGAGTGRAAANQAEQVMCALFAEVLGRPAVGPDDSFFDLGGHSLPAARLTVRVGETFGTAPPIRTIFDTPTPAGLVARLGMTTVPRTPLLARSRPEPMPLSSAQARLWFLYRVEGPAPTWNLPLALRLGGEIDRAALRAALDDVAARHEILRTVFPEHDGVPRQRILDDVRLELPVWQPDDEDQAMRTIARRGFDLAAEPPFRAHLLRLGPEEHVLMLVLHHIAGDAWSAGPLARDLMTAYEARKEGRAPAYEPLPVQYADYTLWRRDLPVTGLEFWRTALAGLPDRLELPVDRPRPAVPSGEGGTVPVVLPPGLMRAARRLARSARASVFMVLHAALAALLTRLGAGTDLPIGTPVAGRGESTLDGAVGFFGNTLVLRADTSGDPSFAELLERVKAADLAAFEHAELPFERLVEALNPPRARNRHPLFQVMLVHPDAPATAGVRVVHTGTAKVDLTLNLDATGSGFLEYSKDLFERASARALAGRLVRLLEQALADPSAPIGRLDLLDAAERRTLLGDRPGDMTTGPAGAQLGGHVVEPGATLPGLFEAQARRTPGATAVGALTYAGLNARANRLAHKLIAYGARPGAVVALSLPRSPDLVVALLAVLKTGAACLPLDPSYPAGRVDRMVADAGPVYVVDEGRLADLDDWLDHDPERDLRPDDAAYVIYTSGATGRPEGVLVTHHNVVRLLSATDRLFGFGPDDVWTLCHSCAFDVSVWELWGALLYGGRLVVVPHEVSRSPADLLALLVRERVTVLNQTPSAFYRLAAADDGRELALRHVIFGGEALEPARLEDWRARRPHGPDLVNTYGITEAAVHVTHLVLEAGERHGGPIGRAIPDLRVYVLDDALRPVPPGVAGEMYVAGDGLARGYLGRPGLTAERFVADPYGPPGTRMYRSGDLARRLPDGTLDHLDRAALPALSATLGEGRLPDGPREETMCALFADVLGVRRVGVDDGFFDLGGHSLLAVRLVARVKEVFGAEVPVGALFEAPTAAGLAALLDGGARRDPLKVLLPLREPGSREPLFCVHPAGGLSWCYGGLIRHLPDRPVYGLQARRDRPPASLRKLAAGYVAQLRMVRPRGPYHLLGWSTGGVIAQEMAVQLRLAGQEVALLAVLDAYPAEGRRDLPPSDAAEALEALLTMGGCTPDGELTIERVVEILRRESSPLAGLPAGTLAELKDLYLGTDRLVRAHDTRPYDGDMLFFRATAGTIDGTPAADAWRPHVSGAIETHDVACGHKDMTRPGPIADIGAIVAARLREPTS